ncbi:MAG: hypothetical protein JW384_04106 [Nitrosomonadaceae bacterium]|nr:hypothetical protein [Nitrosomonadaceae bacterium]
MLRVFITLLYFLIQIDQHRLKCLKSFEGLNETGEVCGRTQREGVNV